MAHVDNQVQLSTRTGSPAHSRPVVPNQHTLAARQPNAHLVTQKLAGPLSGRWLAGPDARLRTGEKVPPTPNL
jgi:hypothetical protein